MNVKEKNVIPQNMSFCQNMSVHLSHIKLNQCWMDSDGD